MWVNARRLAMSNSFWTTASLNEDTIYCTGLILWFILLLFSQWIVLVVYFIYCTVLYITDIISWNNNNTYSFIWTHHPLHTTLHNNRCIQTKYQRWNITVFDENSIHRCIRSCQWIERGNICVCASQNSPQRSWKSPYCLIRLHLWYPLHLFTHGWYWGCSLWLICRLCPRW